MEDRRELLNVRVKDNSYHALFHACSDSGYDYFDDRLCDICAGVLDIEICAKSDWDRLSIFSRLSG